MNKNLLLVFLLIVSNTCFSQENPVKLTNYIEPKVVAVLPVIKATSATNKLIKEEKSISIKQGITRIANNNLYPSQGTYQIIISQDSLTFDITDETLSLISSKRATDDVTYLTINEFVTIKILPYNLIRSEDFVPLKTYRYEN